MEKWIIYGLLAAFFLAAANIPQSIAPAKTTGFEIIFFGGIASLIVGFLGWYFLAPTDIGFTRAESGGYMWSLLAGLFLAIGSTFIVLAYGNIFQSGGNPSTLPAIFNMNTIIVFGLSLLFMSAARDALYTDGIFDTIRFAKIMIGILLVAGGGVLVAMNSNPPAKEKIATLDQVKTHMKNNTHHFRA